MKIDSPYIFSSSLFTFTIYFDQTILFKTLIYLYVFINSIVVVRCGGYEGLISVDWFIIFLNKNHLFLFVKPKHSLFFYLILNY